MSDHERQPPRGATIGALLALLTLLVFWQLLGCSFVYLDDNVYVTGNPMVKAGLTWAGIKWAFQSTMATNWHPLTWISHMLDCQLYGLNPLGPHYTNLLFHIANTLLLFTWLRRLTGAVWRSALVAALFAWHPQHVESVAWVSERKDVLSTFFWLLTLIAYQKFKVQGSKFKVWYGAALLCFLLGLLSKPMVVTLPFVLLLVDWWMAEAAETKTRFSALPWKKWLLQKIPFLALSAGSCVATFLVQEHGGAMQTVEKLPVTERFANAAVSYVLYLEKTFWPVDLSIFYPHPGSWDIIAVSGAVLLLIVITIGALTLSRGRPWLLFGWFWFLGTLVPVIGLVQVGSQSMADRYTYIPLIGIFVIVAWAMGEWAEKRGQTRAAVGIAAVALAACMGLTAVQVGYWKDSESLFKHDIKVTGYNYLACYNLAAYYIATGNPEQALFYIDHCTSVTRENADKLKYEAAVAHFTMGCHLLDHGDPAQGLKRLEKGLELAPSNADFHLTYGEALAKQGHTAEAIDQFHTALKLHPDWVDAHMLLGDTLAGNGDLSGASAEFTAAANANPADPIIQLQFAAFLMKHQKISDAVAHYREAVKLFHKALEKTPDSPALLNNLAWVLAANPNDEIRNGPEAVKLARHACEITQWQNAEITGTLAAAHAEAGQFDDAVKFAKQARETALAAKQNEIAARNEELLKLYEAHKPFREK